MNSELKTQLKTQLNELGTSEDWEESKEFSFLGKLVAIVVLRPYEGSYRLSTTFSNGKTVSKVFTDLKEAFGTYIASITAIDEEIRKVS